LHWEGVTDDAYSSDLWVTGDVPGTKDLGKAVSVSYAVGKASGGIIVLYSNFYANLGVGDINSADMDFAGYHVPNQAYRMCFLRLLVLFDLRYK
jgi:hypothetical protein